MGYKLGALLAEVALNQSLFALHTGIQLDQSRRWSKVEAPSNLAAECMVIVVWSK